MPTRVSNLGGEKTQESHALGSGLNRRSREADSRVEQSPEDGENKGPAHQPRRFSLAPILGSCDGRER